MFTGGFCCCCFQNSTHMIFFRADFAYCCHCCSFMSICLVLPCNDSFALLQLKKNQQKKQISICWARRLYSHVNTKLDPNRNFLLSSIDSLSCSDGLRRPPNSTLSHIAVFFPSPPPSPLCPHPLLFLFSSRAPPLRHDATHSHHVERWQFSEGRVLLQNPVMWLGDGSERCVEVRLRWIDRGLAG